MATPIYDILTQARSLLTERSPRAWTDEDLLWHVNNAVRDLARRIIDLGGNHFVTIDDENMYIGLGRNQIDGVPNDIYRVVLIEPRTIGSSSANRGLVFKPAHFTDPKHIQARARDAITPEADIIWYDLLEQGGPVKSPLIRIAPQVTSLVNLTVAYNFIPESVDDGDDNPVPGASDAALVAYTVAWARAIETDDRAPDPEWLAIYGTEKANIITELSPRQVQEQPTVAGMFEGDGGGWD